MTQSPNLEVSHVSLRSQNGAGRTGGRRDPAEPCSRARHDSAQEAYAGSIAGTESSIRGVSEVLRRSPEAGERDSQATRRVSVGWCAAAQGALATSAPRQHVKHYLVLANP